MVCSIKTVIDHLLLSPQCPAALRPGDLLFPFDYRVPTLPLLHSSPHKLSLCFFHWFFSLSFFLLLLLTAVIEVDIVGKPPVLSCCDRAGSAQSQTTQKEASRGTIALLGMTMREKEREKQVFASNDTYVFLAWFSPASNPSRWIKRRRRRHRLSYQKAD